MPLTQRGREMLERISPTTRIEPFDLDGKNLGLFHGYDYGTTDEVFSISPNIVGMTLTNRAGAWRIVRK